MPFRDFVGKQLGDFEIHRELGRGGMGVEKLEKLDPSFAGVDDWSRSRGTHHE
jgi:hypothetical protein